MFANFALYYVNSKFYSIFFISLLVKRCFTPKIPMLYE